MCTAISYKTNNHYFGRNLDLDFSYSEEVVIMPRNFRLNFRKIAPQNNHYAMIGMAVVVQNEPLFYDAVNEFGLSVAGLDFPKNAHYEAEKEDKTNICQFEFIPYILGNCKDINEVLNLFKNINLVDISYNEDFPVSPLHWMISDKTGSIVVESMKNGLNIHKNPAGVLTNNPPFDYQCFNLNNYRNLKITNGENTFSNDLELDEYSNGLGTFGLPGDVSSVSRFVRAVFNKENSLCENDEKTSVSQFFHILSSVEVLNGACKKKNGKFNKTIYSSCMNCDKGLYYYTTYNNRQINCIDMHKENLNGSEIKRYKLTLEENINFQN